jgi:hypothetical protein
MADEPPVPPPVNKSVRSTAFPPTVQCLEEGLSGRSTLSTSSRDKGQAPWGPSKGVSRGGSKGALVREHMLLMAFSEDLESEISSRGRTMLGAQRGSQSIGLTKPPVFVQRISLCPQRFWPFKIGEQRTRHQALEFATRDPPHDQPTWITTLRVSTARKNACNRPSSTISFLSTLQTPCLSFW